ncbi:hypothetical protein K353_03403 [Kitasatospora sp. SolWspMP-SS2h]|uniref:hypothetical protein n=1 Tax=Kitasatospora sp. SolWspMP-SS2h TaxID=1305729 RepID=UPI000DBF8B6A|nr:hypothetical protein [Kitasatospora sp. SolWspMP-SS2h]RAJ40511.1 hypothetical protein K353_03403 [Kitasatospora sp. SolWspMP-SS2h]
MNASPGIRITAVPPSGAADVGVLLSVDTASAEPGERAVRSLLGHGHEGEEGVHHLLPHDLAARYTRTGDRLAVTLVTTRAVLVRRLAEQPDLLAEFAEFADVSTENEGGDAWVPLLRREPAADVVPADRDGEARAVLLVDHPGPAASPDALPAGFEAGASGLAVLNARW